MSRPHHAARDRVVSHRGGRSGSGRLAPDRRCGRSDDRCHARIVRVGTVVGRERPDTGTGKRRSDAEIAGRAGDVHPIGAPLHLPLNRRESPVAHAERAARERAARRRERRRRFGWSSWGGTVVRSIPNIGNPDRMAVYALHLLGGGSRPHRHHCWRCRSRPPGNTGRRRRPRYQDVVVGSCQYRPSLATFLQPPTPFADTCQL